MIWDTALLPQLHVGWGTWSKGALPVAPTGMRCTGGDGCEYVLFLDSFGPSWVAKPECMR